MPLLAAFAVEWENGFTVFTEAGSGKRKPFHGGDRAPGMAAGFFEGHRIFGRGDVGSMRYGHAITHARDSDS